LGKNQPYLRQRAALGNSPAAALIARFSPIPFPNHPATREQWLTKWLTVYGETILCMVNEFS
jgi:hypothetical protein